MFTLCISSANATRNCCFGLVAPAVITRKLGIVGFYKNRFTLKLTMCSNQLAKVKNYMVENLI